MKNAWFVLPVSLCVLYLYCNLNLTTMFTKENASMYGRLGGIATMSNPENARAIGRAGGLAGGKKNGPTLGRKNVEDGTLERARQQRNVNYRNRWYNVLLNVDREFTTGEVVKTATDMGVCIGSVKGYLRQEEGCVKIGRGKYRKNLKLF